jgi:L-lactate oxidase
MSSSRRELLKASGVGLAAAAAGISLIGAAHAQVAEESGTDPLSITRKGINKDLEVISADILEQQAKAMLPEGVYVFISHGNGEQWTLRENRRAFGDYVFTPHRMGGVVRSKIDTSVTLLGEKLPHPVIISPMGSHGLVHPAAETATADGAARSGGLLCVSSASTAAMEDIAKASTGPKWFQMYLTVDRGESKAVLERARDAGFKAIILTIDAIGQGSSDEYVRLGRTRPWLPYGNFPTGNANAFKTDLNWADLEFIRTTTGLPVVVKGVTRPEDAVAAVKNGASAIQVSNHGGRALDGTPASITVLPKIADALKGSAPIIMDSGIRRGMDVAKALALGANAVAVGRPVWWSLALGGAGGVNGMLEYFNRELVNTMLHLGVDKIASLNGSHVQAFPG